MVVGSQQSFFLFFYSPYPVTCLPMAKNLRVCFCIVWLFALIPLRNQGQECNFRNYSVADGLPQSQVNDIHQDYRGYVWLATQGAGISRFDGNVFRNYSTSEGLGSGIVSSIVEWNQTVWCGTTAGLFQFNRGSWNPADSNLGLELDITAMATTEENLWVGTRSGLARFVDGRLEKIETRTGLDNAEIRVLKAEGDSLWVGTFRQGLFVVKGNENWWKVNPVGEGRGLGGKKIRALIRDGEGRLWVGTSGKGLFRQEAGRFLFAPYTIEGQNYNPFITAGTKVSDTELWFGSWGGGIVRVNIGKVSSWKVENGLPENTIKSLFCDREGNVWVGTFASGFSIFLGESVKKFKTDHGLAGNNVRSIALGPDGNLWIATLGGLSVMKEARLETALENTSNAKPRVGSVVTDPEGGVYFATYFGEIYYYKDAKLTKLSKPEKGLTEILSLYLDSSGVLWVGTYRGGLFRYKNGWLPKLYGQDEYLNEAIWCFHEVAGGDFYIGTEQGIFRKKDEALEPYNLDPELKRFRINSITSDDQKRLYVGTNGAGMVALEPEKQSFRYFKDVDGETSAHIFGVLIFKEKLYLANLSGITEVDLETFWGKGEAYYRHFGRAEGLGGVEYNPNSIAADAMGNIWFGSNLGAICYHPEFRTDDFVPPKAELTAIQINGLPMDINTFQDSIRSGAPFEFSFLEEKSKLSFQLTNLIFRKDQEVITEYRILGIDSTWVVIDNLTNTIEFEPGEGSYTIEARARVGESLSEVNRFSFNVRHGVSSSYWLLYLSLLTVFFAGLGGIFTINRSRSNSHIRFSGARQEAFTGRLVGFIAIFAYPVSGYLFAVNEPVKFEDMAGHFAIGALIGLMLLSTYVYRPLAKKVPQLLKIGFMGVLIHILFMVHYTQFHPNHIIGLFVVVSGITIALRSIRDTIIFAVFLFTGACIVVLTTENTSGISNFLFIGALSISITIAFVVIISRLNLFNRLTFSDKIVNQPNNLVLAVNPSGEVVFANPGIKELLGYEVDEVLGMGWWEVRSNNANANADELRATMEIASNQWTGELARESEILAKDGTIRTIYWVYSRLPDRTVIGLGQDITSLKKARKELHELSLVASKTDNYVIITGADDRISWVNRGFTAITGYEMEEVIGELPSKLLRGPKTTQEQAQAINDLVAKGLPFREEVLNYRKDGTPVWLSLNVTPVLDAYGNLEKYITIGSDITDRKRSEEQLKYYAERLSFIHSVDRIILEAGSSLDMIHKINWRLFQHLRAKRVGLFLFDQQQKNGQLVSIQTPNSQVVIEQDIRLGSIIDLNRLDFNKALRFRDPIEVGLDGSHPFWNQVQLDGGVFCPLVFNRESIGFLLLQRAPGEEITDEEVELVEEVVGQLAASVVQSRLQETIRRSNVALERRNRDIENINNELRQFAHVVSHDLKAPLRAIGSLANWILEDNQENLTEDGLGQMEMLMGRVKRMNSLIEGILAYSKLGQKRELITEINLNDLVGDLMPNFTGSGKTNILVEGNLPVIQGQPTRILQLFQNLVGNAVKYMDKEEGWVKIGVNEEPGQWQFYVQDNGPGIDNRYHEKIFQIFQTLQSRDDRESTGVGLSIVKKIVEQHGGKIWLESEPGTGTTFYFTLNK